jgi:hypothetical protein
VCIEFSSNVAEEIKKAKLSSILAQLERWNTWDDISALANHADVRRYLLDSIAENRDPDVRFHSFIFFVACG